jgi:hypothetical protein
MSENIDSLEEYFEGIDIPMLVDTLNSDVLSHADKIIGSLGISCINWKNSSEVLPALNQIARQFSLILGVEYNPNDSLGKQVRSATRTLVRELAGFQSALKALVWMDEAKRKENWLREWTEAPATTPYSITPKLITMYHKRKIADAKLIAAKEGGNPQYTDYIEEFEYE